MNTDRTAPRIVSAVLTVTLVGLVLIGLPRADFSGGSTVNETTIEHSATGLQLPPIRVSERPARPVDRSAVPLHGKSRAFARAYAWLGQGLDGHAPEGSALDLEAQAWVEQARELLAEQGIANWQDPRQTVPGRSGGLATIDRTASPVSGGHGDDALPPGHVAPRPRVIRRPPGPEAIQQSHHSLTIQQADLMAHQVFRADEHIGVDFVIRDASLGRHVLIVDVADCSDLRLNGGLVVPGRAYLIDGSIAVRSGADLHLLIRPVDAVSAYHLQTAQVPFGDG
ncbi:MAG: hypothetical protein PF961_15385 [Planctomycetota bacterium]|jgi:hypothetical protein|nr:hypothetical protein [Planctomycetota bacterium]